MTWFKVDDKFWCHPKFIGLPNSTVGLWVKIGAYCAQHETDGLCTEDVILRLLAGRRRDLGGLQAALLLSRLPDSHPPVYQMVDWHQYQPSRDDLQERRDQWRASKRRQRDVHAGQGVESPGSQPLPDPTRPITPYPHSAEPVDNSHNGTPIRLAPDPTTNPNTDAAVRALHTLAEQWNVPSLTFTRLVDLAQEISPDDLWNGYQRIRQAGERTDFHRPDIRSPIRLLRSHVT